MPELPEVETVARGVSRLITGLIIDSVCLERADIAHGTARPCDDTLRGHRIERVARTGKQVRIDLTGGLALVVHLGMTGRLTVTHAAQPIAKHTHLRIHFKESTAELRFTDPRRFGGLWLVHSSGEGASWTGRRLPPVAADPLAVTLREWRRLLARRRQIKALLLDQSPISGVGNIYCDEALHRAGIHPLSRAADLGPESIRRLYRALRQVLAAAIKAGGSSIIDYRDADGAPGWFQTRHRVYGREGKPCRKCGTPIKKIFVSGRGTHICPKCQPAI
jgi:formamidopyrimidine-DNA glycosylase